MSAADASRDARSRMKTILMLHEQIDEIKLEIRQVYADEKADGGDKTAMGAAISHIRKREKDRDAFDDREAIVGVYLAAYERNPSHVHARERNHPAPEHKTAGNARRDVGSDGANAGDDDVDRSAERAGHAGQDQENALPGQVETQDNVEFIERNTSGPDDKRATHLSSGADCEVRFGEPHQAGNQSGVVNASAEHASDESSATNSPETASEAPMVVYGDSAEGDGPFQANLSTFHPAGQSDGRRDGAEHQPAATNSPETATRLGQDVQSPRQCTSAPENLDVTAGETATVPVSEQSEGKGQRDRQHVPSRQTDGATHGGQDQSAAALDHAPNPQSARSSSRAEQTGAVVPPPAAAPVDPFEPPAFLARQKTMADYRPHCLEPDACRSSILDHCYTCRKALEAAEQEFAA